MTRWTARAYLGLSIAATPGLAKAHASEQGFVLLLPTEVYTGAGVVAVLLTILVLAAVPGRAASGVFTPLRIPGPRVRALPRVTQMVSALLFVALIFTGFAGPRDPLANPLVLVVWTVFWIGLVTLQGLVGDIWRWVSPFLGALRWARLIFGRWRYLPWPRWCGRWLAVLGFLVFGYVMLADPRPADPDHLARLVLTYFVFHLVATLAFGPRWLATAEVFTAVMRAIGRVAIFGRKGGRVALGLPGWQLSKAPVSLGSAVLCIAILGIGSFDGLNETFWWLGLLGMNPLEFSGRSAVVLPNTVGMAVAVVALTLAFALMLQLGARLVGASLALGMALQRFAPSLLPIALGYHVAHYLPSFLVDAQWALVALSDPLMTGADLLGLGQFYVSTGFFNQLDSVRVIYLTQAGAVVIGHMLAVLVAHEAALRMFADRREAVLFQMPLGAFMLGYTYFGLWLLASPRF